MSLLAFQSNLLRLIADPEFRDRVIADGEAALDRDLNTKERQRLQRIAIDRGLEINRTLHKGFRLGKLRALLPLTCTLLGSRRLTRELPMFWMQRPASSFSFIPEALEFCAYLAKRKPRIRYLDEVLGYERATLELERARIGDAPAQIIRFHHDPTQLLGALSAGKRPRAISVCECRIIGTRDGDGQVCWHVENIVCDHMH